MKILLPIDGSEPALEAVRQAIRLTREGLRASFVVANVQEPARLYEMVRAHDAATIERASQAAGAHLLAAAEEMLRHAGLEFDSEVGSGDPGHVLVDVAERYGCDMVVMAASNPGGVRDALLGSVSRSVLHGANIPVLVVKTLAS
jgi:nucleotide-binding universal stress UspA family protein